MSRLPIANSFAQGAQTGLGILDLLAQRERQQQRAAQEQQIMALREAQFAQQQQQQALQTAALKAQSQFNMRRIGDALGPEALDPEMQQLLSMLPPSAQERFAKSVEEQALLENERAQTAQKRQKMLMSLQDAYQRSESNPALAGQFRDQLGAIIELMNAGLEPSAGTVTALVGGVGDANTGGLSLTPSQTSAILRDISQSRIEETRAIQQAINNGLPQDQIDQIRSDYAQYRQERSGFLRDSGFPEDRIPKEPDRPEPTVSLTPEENQSLATDLLSTAQLISGQAPGQEQTILSAMSTLQTNPEFIRAWTNNDKNAMVALVRQAITAQSQPQQPQARPSTYNAIQP